MKLRKKGGGSMLLKDGRVVNKGDIFECDLKDIPKAFHDLIEPMEDIPVEIPKLVISHYKLQKRSPGWWNVVDRYGKTVNDIALRKDEAEDLIKTL